MRCLWYNRAQGKRQSRSNAQDLAFSHLPSQKGIQHMASAFASSVYSYKTHFSL